MYEYLNELERRVYANRRRMQEPDCEPRERGQIEEQVVEDRYVLRQAFEDLVAAS